MNKITNNEKGIYAHLKTNDTVLDIVNHPAFQGFSQYILPWDNNTHYYDTPLDNVNSLLPYHNHVDPEIVVEAINHMIDEVGEGKRIFYDFYTEMQKQEATKEFTCIFFFRGELGAPFAVVCSGGAFEYVGSFHEGFPYALELSKKGYNAFVLRYRVGSELRATEDLAAALSYIFENADILGVNRADYSLWGSSAGARLVARIGSDGAAGYGVSDLPKPCIIVMAYTAHPDFSGDDPPTFVMVSEDDTIVDVAAVERRVEALKNAGIEVEYHRYNSIGHGFGLGIGTEAEGWIENAVQFWENHLSKNKRI